MSIFPRFFDIIFRYVDRIDTLMTFRRDTLYNDLPDLPPSAEIETVAILKTAIRANKALAELKISGRLTPNQAVLIQTLGLS